MAGHTFEINEIIHRASHATNKDTRRKGRLQLKVLEKNNYGCAYCLIKTKLTIDHIQPIGEPNKRKLKHLKDLNNLQILCDKCHMLKTNLENQ